MAKDTPLNYRNLVIYEVYVRNHGPNGTFADVEADLERIRSMGVDVVWFMPIHPIGKLNKKGSLGCPYSISDYREVNPEYGTRQDFKRLIDKAHDLGMKVMIDVVYNHTAHDSVLVSEHPEFFHQDENGKPVTTVPEWSDVIDLKHPQEELTDYLHETLKQWALFGVDGFRCDVASLLPARFWTKARKRVAKVKPSVIWLAESVHAGWVAWRRANNLSAISDSELYRGFDMTYDYDIWPVYQAAVKGLVPVARYLDVVRFQDCIYPANYVKMRCAENHDQPRIMTWAPSRQQALAWTALEAFNKGSFLIYGGQESGADHQPSLFEIDKVEWGTYELQDFLTRLANLKKDRAQMDGELIWLKAESAVQAAWYLGDHSLFGLFNTAGETGMVDVALPDGTYINLLDDQAYEVEDGKISLPADAFITRCALSSKPEPYFSDLLDGIKRE